MCVKISPVRWKVLPEIERENLNGLVGGVNYVLHFKMLSWIAFGEVSWHA